jgi:type I restriction enzyme S subunit
MKVGFVALGEVSEFIRGITFTPNDIEEASSTNTVGVMRTKNVQEQLDLNDVWQIDRKFIKNKKQYLEEGDLLVSSANSWNLVGKASWVPRLNYEASFGGFITVLRGDKKLVDRRFLYYWFVSDRIQQLLRSFSNKTTNISNLSLSRAKELKIPLPPLVEQQRIAALLDAADHIVKLRVSAIAKLDQLAQSMFVEMFGNNKFPSKSLKQLGKVKTGGTPPSSKEGMFGSLIPFITPGDLENKSKPKRFLSVEGATESVVVKKGSALVCCIGATIGKMSKAKSDCAFNQQLNAVEWSDEINADFGIYALRQIKSKIISGGTATTLPIIKKSLFEKLEIIVPPYELQNKFCEGITKIEKLVDLSDLQLIKFRSLVNSLQHQSFAVN